MANGSARILESERRVNRKMSAQLGLISRQQALSIGLTRTAIQTRLKNGSWILVFPCVYRRAGSPVTWKQQILAAILWAGEGAVVFGRSAARVWRLEGCNRDAVEIAVESGKRPPEGIRIHRRSISPSEQTYIGKIPVTTVTRTLFDLAALVPTEELLNARDDALRRRLTSWERLKNQLAKSNGQPGVRIFRRAMTGDYIGESYLERMFLRIARTYGLPRLVPQFEVRLKNGRVAHIDFAFPEDRLAIEIDGGRHRDGVRRKKDRIRTNGLTELGYRELRFEEDDLEERPAEVAAQILSTLQEIRKGRASRQPSTIAKTSSFKL